MGIELFGNQNGVAVEVGANNLAAYANFRPNDRDLLSGSYGFGASIKTADQGSLPTPNAAYFAARAPGPSACMIKRILASSVMEIAGTGSAGVHAFRLFRTYGNDLPIAGGSAYTQSNTGQIGSQANSRSPASQLDFATATDLLGGLVLATGNGRKIDTNPACMLTGSAPATTGKAAIPAGSKLYSIEDADEPLILLPYDGFEIWLQYLPTVSGSTLIRLGLSLLWDEIALLANPAYPF